MRTHGVIIAMVLAAHSAAGSTGTAQASTAPPGEAGKPVSEGVYRLPYADGSRVSVFDDADTHRPAARVDLVGEPREGRTHRIVAAADGVVMAIQDGFGEQQSGRAAADCRNNYVWIAHPNGEWTLYSHMRLGTSTGAAGLKVGERVRAGRYLGDEGSVGCAMLSHLHFEIAVPTKANPIDPGGFVTDNAGSHRNRIPRFCLPEPAAVRKDAIYTAQPCPKRPR